MLLSNFTESGVCQQILINVPNIKYYGNPCSGSLSDPSGKTDGGTDGRTNMTKVICTFSDYGNALKKSRFLVFYQ
jgi:hypothetical protein